MELEEYLQNNNVTLWRNNRALGPQKTKSLADFDYAEGLENITGKMVWICDYRANADPTKKPIRGIEPTPVVVTDAKETNKIIYWSHTRILIPTVLNASRLPEPQTAYMSSMPTVSSIKKIPQSAMSSIC